MQIVIIGSGNVAYHMAKAFTKGIPLLRSFGRNEKELSKISEELKVPIPPDHWKMQIFISSV
jgi:Trk K+ transport system NAD-binding subunit